MKACEMESGLIRQSAKQIDLTLEFLFGAASWKNKEAFSRADNENYS